MAVMASNGMFDQSLITPQSILIFKISIDLFGLSSNTVHIHVNVYVSIYTH